MHIVHKVGIIIPHKKVGAALATPTYCKEVRHAYLIITLREVLPWRMM